MIIGYTSYYQRICKLPREIVVFCVTVYRLIQRRSWFLPVMTIEIQQLVYTSTR